MTSAAGGTPPDVDDHDADLADWAAEALERLEAGEPVDLDALMAAHPARAEELRRVAQTIQRMASFGRAVARTPEKPRTAEHDELGTLGDFRLLREVGRGGMGVVYEALQVSLGRRVALKILPLAGALDPRQHQRFLLEARAAACLHHAHIVPVHAVGSERGVPFYAMQFIDGCTLAQVLERLPDRDPRGSCQTAPGSTSLPGTSSRDRSYVRAVAEHGQRAADALDHAHGRGIIHRDIKPANLMLDVAGHLWITDFGLAQIQGDSRLTLTGDCLGTLRYMSPEQALGRRVVVDGRTDIYSLGATLYELLALEPVVDGADRAEILRKIAEDEPRPLGRLNAAVPRDLETIIHKTLAREPAERYATARELADDLRRFLDARPIAARPPGRWERLGKWARRNRAVVAPSALFAVLTLVALGCGLVWSNNWLSRHSERLRVERDRANELSGQLKAQRDLAEERRRVADHHLYAFRLRQAAEAHRVRQLEKTQEILRDCRPAPGEDDPREFAWRHLWRESRREVAVLSERDERVDTLALSPGGRVVASGDHDGTIRLRDAATGSLIRQFRGQKTPIGTLAFSADGRRLASGTTFEPGDRERRGGELVVWDTASGRPVARLGGFDRRVTTHIRFAPSGEFLWERSQNGDADAENGLWTLEGQRRLLRPRLIRRWVCGNMGLSVSADGRRIASCEEGGRVAVVMEALTGRVICRLPQAFAYRGLGLSGDGRLVATATTDGRGGALEIGVWEADTGRRLFDRHDGPSGWFIDVFEFGPDDRSLLALGLGGALRHYALDMGQTWILESNPKDQEQSAGAVSLLPGGRLLALSYRGSHTGPRPVGIYERASGDRRATFPGHPDVAGNLAGLPDERSLALRSGSRALVWKFEPVVDPQPAGHDDEAWSAAVSAGGLLVTGGDDTDDARTLRIWDVTTGRLLRGWKAHEGTTAAIAAQPGGPLIASAGLAPWDNLRLWNVETGRLVATLDGHTDRVRSVAFRPDGRLLASGGSDRAVRLWDVQTGRCVRVLAGHSDAVRQVAFSPDGRTVASAGNDATVRLWDVERGQMTWTWEGDSKVSSLAFAPDGHMLAWGHEDGVIQRFDLAGGRPLAPLHSEYDELRCLAFAPDGRTLAAAGNSGTIHLWEPAAGQELLTLEGRPCQLNGLAFSADGSTLVACWHDGTVRIVRSRE